MSELFSAFGIDWKLLLTQAFNFAVLLIALRYFLYMPVLKMIADRREKIAEGVRNAERAQQELDEAKGKGAEIVGAAAREAEVLSQNARARADERAHEIVRTAESKAGALLKDAGAKAEEAKRQALKESEREIARAAMLAAEKILREKHS